MRRLWLIWSWRDLRSRPLQVVVIALVIAIGTGVATGLSSLQTWRTASNDASFAALRYHDVRATLPEGGFTREGSLERALRDVDAGAVGLLLDAAIDGLMLARMMRPDLDLEPAWIAAEEIFWRGLRA
mgnify:CR=1 FL=1